MRASSLIAAAAASALALGALAKAAGAAEPEFSLESIADADFDSVARLVDVMGGPVLRCMATACDILERGGEETACPVPDEDLQLTFFPEDLRSADYRWIGEARPRTAPVALGILPTDRVITLQTGGRYGRDRAGDVRITVVLPDHGDPALGDVMFLPETLPTQIMRISCIHEPAAPEATE